MAEPKPADLIFPERRGRIQRGEPARGFRDEVSRKEYAISGMCQYCQDGVFGTEQPR